MRKAIILILAGMSVTACGLLRGPDDPFFEAPYEEWTNNARKLPTERVYALFKEEIEMPPPRDYALAAALGERGRPALDLMVADLERGDETILKGYYSLLGEIHRRSGFDFCSNGYYYRINRALEKATRFNYPKDRTYAGGSGNAFDRMCGLYASSKRQPSPAGEPDAADNRLDVPLRR